MNLTEDVNTEKLSINRGVRQGDLDWELKGINVDGRYLSHLCFADDIVLFSIAHKELC